MDVQSRVLKLLQGAKTPLSARQIQRRTTGDTDPTARNVRRALRRLRQGGHPIVSSAHGHLYLHSDMRYNLTLKGARALRG